MPSRAMVLIMRLKKIYQLLNYRSFYLNHYYLINSFRKLSKKNLRLESIMK